ncbi:MAG: DUF4396 domain-containing protein [Nocardioidaceae bacterium]
MPSTWLTILSLAFLALSFACAAEIAYDIRVRGYRQPMGVMEAVWPVTALYFGPVATVAYRAWGRPATRRYRGEHGEAPRRPPWTGVAIGVSHCGAGCTLGDVIAEFVVYSLGVTVAGLSLIPAYIGDYIAAVVIGVFFQYFAIAPMRGLGFREGMWEATKADILSLTSFEVGLFGWMALMSFVFFPSPHLEPNSPVFWFLMQIGMMLGFATAYPTNVWLIRRGVKEAM